MGSTSPLTCKRPSWQDLSFRYAEQRECLASYLALEAAEVLEGAKPANLINIVDRRRSCGRNPYELWYPYGAEVLSESGLEVLVLGDRTDSVLLLIFSPSAIEELLHRPGVTALLKNAGYEEPASKDLVFAELSRRMTGNSFPHEIGVFLGYPLKDVAAFMGLVRLPFSCQGPWKIFGNPLESLRLAESFRCCRMRMSERLRSGASPFACLDKNITKRVESIISAIKLKMDVIV